MNVETPPPGFRYVVRDNRCGTVAGVYNALENAKASAALLNIGFAAGRFTIEDTVASQSKANIIFLRTDLRASDRATATYRWLCIPIAPGGAASGPSWWFRTRNDARTWARLFHNRTDRYVIGSFA